MTAREIAALFEDLELRLIASLKRNLARHKAEEKDEGFDWPAWQAEKLHSLQRFRRENKSIMPALAGARIHRRRVAAIPWRRQELRRHIWVQPKRPQLSAAERGGAGRAVPPQLPPPFDNMGRGREREARTNG